MESKELCPNCGKEEIYENDLCDKCSDQLRLLRLKERRINEKNLVNLDKKIMELTNLVTDYKEHLYWVGLIDGWLKLQKEITEIIVKDLRYDKIKDELFS